MSGGDQPDRLLLRMKERLGETAKSGYCAEGENGKIVGWSKLIEVVKYG